MAKWNCSYESILGALNSARAARAGPEGGLWSRTAWVRTLVLPLPDLVTSEAGYHLSMPLFPSTCAYLLGCGEE